MKSILKLTVVALIAASATGCCNRWGLWRGSQCNTCAPSYGATYAPSSSCCGDSGAAPYMMAPPSLPAPQ